MTGKLLRVNVAAKRLGVSQSYVRKLIALGELDARDVGSGKVPRYRVLEKSLQKYQERSCDYFSSSEENRHNRHNRNS